MAAPMQEPSLHRAPVDAGSREGQESLWQRWREHTDIAARDALIQVFLPYARVVAAVYYKGRTHDEVEFADYLQLASMGMLDAVERFDPAQGAQFKTYAAHRMRGAILNGLEKMSEKSQQIAFHKRVQKERLADLTSEAQATVREQSALLRYLADVGVSLAIGMLLEGTGMVEALDGTEPQTHVSPEVSYFKKSEMQQLQIRLRELLSRLSAPEQTVIRGHYLQEIPFEQIASMLGVTRSRVSQLHRQALLKLRSALGQGPPLDIDW